MIFVASLFTRHDSATASNELTGTWSDFIEGLKKPLDASVPKGDLPLWSPAKFRDGHRSERNVELVYALALDIDEEPVPSADDIFDDLYMNGLRAFVHSSSSATETAPRWRGIVALSRPVTADEYRAIWSVFTKRSPFPVGQAAKDPSRAWYFPRRGPDGFFECFEVDGEPLDVDALLAELPPLPTKATEAPTYPGDVQADTKEHAHRLKLYEKYLRETPPCIQGRGGDARLFEVVQHGAYDLQLPTDDVLRLVREVFDPRCVPPWGAELESRVHHKAHDAKTTSTRPRAEPLPHDLGHLVLEMPPLPPRDETSADPKKRRGIVFGGWDEPVDPPVYLVQGLIPVETVGMFVAMGSSLKTWTALDIARAISRGVPWLEKFPTKKGKALFVDYESGAYELRRRVRLLENGELTDLGMWPYPEKRIDDEDFWRDLASIEGLLFVVIDSLAAGAPGVDENDANVALPMKLAARWTVATGGAVLFIHHSRKDESDDRKMVRGSTAIYADCDWAFKFDSVEETKDHRRMYMVSIKPCMGPKPAPVPLELTDEGLHTFETSPVATTRDAPEHEVASAIRLALSARPIETKVKLAAAVGIRKERVVAELEAMLVRREVAFIEGSGFVLDSPEARDKRVRELVASGRRFKSEAAIAKAAGLLTSEVLKMMDDGLICRSAEGRYQVVNR